MPVLRYDEHLEIDAADAHDHAEQIRRARAAATGGSPGST
jgi:hypothetical protein